MMPHLRIAKPVSDIDRTRDMYCKGLGLRILGNFVDHDGFDGVMLGTADACCHLEFTCCHTHPLLPAPTAEDLLVFYLPDKIAWDEACARMLDAGFKRIASFNPFWELRGRTFIDPDGYRIVMQNAGWPELLSSMPPAGSFAGEQ